MLPIKIAIVGNSSVGKTQLINILTGNKFDYKYNPTMSVDFNCLLSNDKKKPNFEFWDISGAEKSGNMIKLYLKDTLLYIVVCDITRESSIVAMRDWINLVKKYTNSKCPYYLVFNKTDLIVRDYTDRQIESFVELYIDKNYMPQKIYTTSCLSLNSNSETIQNIIADLRNSSDCLVVGKTEDIQNINCNTDLWITMTTMIKTNFEEIKKEFTQFEKKISEQMDNDIMFQKFLIQMKLPQYLTAKDIQMKNTIDIIIWILEKINSLTVSMEYVYNCATHGLTNSDSIDMIMKQLILRGYKCELIIERSYNKIAISWD